MATESSFVEDSFALTPKDVLRNIQRPHRIGTAADDRRDDVDYWLEHPSDVSVVMVSVGKREPQRVVMEWEVMTFGERAYFRCGCGLRVAKLLLPLNGTEFKCRKCHRLQYQLTCINRRSIAGASIYRMNRLRKLTYNRAGMSRIFYNGNYTKRFERFLGLCDRAGLDGIVRGAHDLKTLLEEDHFVQG